MQCWKLKWLFFPNTTHLAQTSTFTSLYQFKSILSCWMAKDQPLRQWVQKKCAVHPRLHHIFRSPADALFSTFPAYTLLVIEPLHTLIPLLRTLPPLLHCQTVSISGFKQQPKTHLFLNDSPTFP